MFSKTCEYGIRATIYIAQQSKLDKRASLKDIAAEIDSPIAFTAKILQELVKNKIIYSIQGAKGGFEITKEDLIKICLLEVINALDGDHLFSECALGLKKCSDIHPCPIHHKIKPIKEDLIQVLSSTSLIQVAETLIEGNVFLMLKKSKNSKK